MLFQKISHMSKRINNADCSLPLPSVPQSPTMWNPSHVDQSVADRSWASHVVVTLNSRCRVTSKIETTTSPDLDPFIFVTHPSCHTMLDKMKLTPWWCGKAHEVLHMVKSSTHREHATSRKNVVTQNPAHVSQKSSTECCIRRVQANRWQSVSIESASASA